MVQNQSIHSLGFGAIRTQEPTCVVLQTQNLNFLVQDFLVYSVWLLCMWVQHTLFSTFTLWVTILSQDSIFFPRRQNNNVQIDAKCCSLLLLCSAHQTKFYFHCPWEIKGLIISGIPWLMHTHFGWKHHMGSDERNVAW